MEIIDLRSDTVTLPSTEMKEAMMNSLVGDDVYGEDSTVNALQRKLADLFGKEDALFVPSGTMSNQIALAINTETGNEVIIDENAHIFYYETAAPSIISRVLLRTLPSSNGMIDIDLIKSSIRTSEYYLPKTTLICMENTHNRHCGAILDYQYLKEVKQIANEHNLKYHLDGARIWNAAIETGVSFKEYGELFDTISVCLSKGLGAPVGSVLIGSHYDIQKAIKWRKILGGGMRQAGIIAAAGIYAIDNNLSKLKNDHINAKVFAKELISTSGLNIDLNKVQTNMVFINLDNKINPTQFNEELLKNNIKIGFTNPKTIRVVFHLDIDSNKRDKAIEIFKQIAWKLMK